MNYEQSEDMTMLETGRAIIFGLSIAVLFCLVLFVFYGIVFLFLCGVFASVLLCLSIDYCLHIEEKYTKKGVVCLPNKGDQ